MVNKEQGEREPSIVADPGLDPMSALRQTTEQAKAVTEGTVSTPAIEAVKNSKEAVGAELAAMPPMKYSRDGIPEGLDHVSEMERLRAMIQGGTASATDIDNYITLQTRAHNQAAQEFARSSEGNVVDMMGGPDETGTAPAGSAAGKAAREVPAAEEAPAPRSSMRSSGSVRGSGVDRGQPPSAGAQPRPSSRGPVGGSKQSVVNPSAEAAPVKGKYKEEPSGNFNRTRIPEGTVDRGKSFTNMEGNGAAYKMASKGMSLDNPPPEKGMASYEDPRMKAWVTSGPGRTPEKASPPSKVAALKPGDKFYEMRGETNPDIPSSGPAYQHTMGGMLPSMLGAGMALEATRAGVPAVGRLGERIETELMPGAMNLGRKAAAKLAGREAGAAESAVNNNISRVPKPPGLVKASLPPKPSGKDVRQQIRQAEYSEKTVRDSLGKRDGDGGVFAAKARAQGTKPKSATEASRKASEYLEKRNASAASKERTKANIKQKKTQGKGQNL